MVSVWVAAALFPRIPNFRSVVIMVKTLEALASEMLDKVIDQCGVTVFQNFLVSIQGQLDKISNEVSTSPILHLSFSTCVQSNRADLNASSP